MINKEILKKQIIYRSTHRGSKEMDILLGDFVKKNIDNLNDDGLIKLIEILDFEDGVLYGWCFKKTNSGIIPNNKISEMLKKFKI